MAIINGRGRVGARPSSGGGTPTPSYLLDTYSGAVGAYSLRKLSSTYNGSAIRVRRSSDNTEMNIGFNSDGSLNTSALLTFVGAGNGFVVIIYDQSGNNINQKQPTASFQSKIVTSGVLETHNGKPVIKSDNWGYDFNNGTVNVNLVYKNMFFVGKVDTQNSTGLNIIISQGFYERIWLNSSTGKMGVYKHDYGTNYPGSPIIGGRSYEMTSTGLNQTLLYVNMKSMNIYMSANGNPETLMGAWGSANSANNTLSMGAYSGDYKFNGKFNEMILWNSEQSSNKSGIETNINNYYSIYTPLDADAQAFITAASITDSTQMSAVNTLVTSLKTAGIWSKMKAIYPFVGGNATAHSKNLKNSSQYNLTFSSGWSHSSNGAEANGSAYSDTSLNPVTDLSLYNAHSSVYQRSATVNSGFDIGNTTNGAWNKEFLLTSYRGGQAVSGLYDYFGDGSIISTSITNGAGFTNNSITSNTSTKLYKNGSVIGSNTNLNNSQPNNCNIYIAAVNANPGVVEYRAGKYAFVSIGDGLSDAESLSLYTSVQAFQTTLGRQVV